MDTITDGQLIKLIETMRQKGMTPGRFNALLGSGILADVLDSGAYLDDRDAVRVALRLSAAVPEPLMLAVDYDQTLESMIAAGQYNWVNRNITREHFPVKGEGVWPFEPKLFHFKPNVHPEAAVEKIRGADTTNPWRPTQIEHLLAFGTKFPEEQLRYPIVALGSVTRIDGRLWMPSLDRCGTWRTLSLGWWGGGRPDVCRFLAVRPVENLERVAA